MPPKLNSMRMLDQNKIAYAVMEYPDTLRDAVQVADAVGAPREIVYKTLVVQDIDKPKKPFLVMVPAECQLNLKKTARAAGVKKMRMASHNDAESMTGLKVGGISPLALTHKQWNVFIDQRAEGLEQIVISAGQRGLQIRTSISELAILLKARFVDVAV
jgi:Cys-tRNA(Pro)/Cys-tRNA(Cys) deacylase